MLFNSFNFFYFFILVLIIYYCLNQSKQNKFLLLASYIFYASWDYRFLSLILLSTLLDYICALKIIKSNYRKYYLALSVFGNLGILCVFKYYDFFAKNLEQLFILLDIPIHLNFLNIILPIGISFYTFQTLSYTIDVYFKKIQPSKNLINFALFVSFFPQLMAGPIEKASKLLPQIEGKRSFNLNLFYNSCFLIGWGLFQKVVVADNISQLIAPFFQASTKGSYNGMETIITGYLFVTQVYCDFAGYSNMARGIAGCLGFNLIENFRWPDFSSNPSELWQRWHISLSQWFRDYVYIPISVNRSRLYQRTVSVFLVMFLVGLWHGANWTFVVWGIYQALLIYLYDLVKILKHSNLTIQKKFLPIDRIIKIFIFHSLWALGGLIFASKNITHTFEMFQSIIYNFNLHEPLFYLTKSLLIEVIALTGFLYLVEFFQFKVNDVNISRYLNFYLKIIFYTLTLYLFIVYATTNSEEFIYFQF